MCNIHPFVAAVRFRYDNAHVCEVLHAIYRSINSVECSSLEYSMCERWYSYPCLCCGVMVYHHTERSVSDCVALHGLSVKLQRCWIMTNTTWQISGCWCGRYHNKCIVLVKLCTRCNSASSNKEHILLGQYSAVSMPSPTVVLGSGWAYRCCARSSGMRIRTQHVWRQHVSCSTCTNAVLVVYEWQVH